MNSNILTNGNNIRVWVADTQPPFQTEAFGGSSDTPGSHFTPGTTLVDMIMTLQAAGYDGQTLDAYPTIADSGNPTVLDGSGDGEIIADLDGLTIFEQTGDLRPYQFMKWCEIVGIPGVIYDYFPINPSDTAENVYPGQFDITGLPQLFYTSPNAIKTFEDGAVKKIESPNEIIANAFRGNIGLGAYTGEETGESHMTNWSHLASGSGLHQEGNQYGHNRPYLKGNEIYTQSREDSNNAYGYVLMDGDPDNPESKPWCTVSYGNIKGSGSVAVGTSEDFDISPSRAVYTQFANMLRNLENSGSFYSASGSLVYPGYEDAPLESGGTAPGLQVFRPDGDAYFIALNKEIVKDGLKPEFSMVLSGSTNGSNAVRTLKLGSDWSDNPSGYIEPGSGLKRYNIVSGSGVMHHNSHTLGDKIAIPATHRRYGWFYPEVGVWVINGVAGNNLFGGIGGPISDTHQKAFNDPSPDNNSLGTNGRSKNDKDYYNALGLVNCLRNRGSDYAIAFQPQLHGEEYLCCIAKVGANELNHSLNPTKNKPNGDINNFEDTMTWQNDGVSGPVTYPNQIQLYDKNGHLVAIGNFSKPIRKDFRRELIIKTIIPL